MGCDFDFVIEALHHGKWIPIIYLGTKTKCGGFPLALATFDLYTKSLIKGDYHRSNQNKISKEETVAAVIMGIVADSRKKSRKAKKGKKRKKSCNVDLEEEKPLLFYSKSQFESLISNIKPLSYMEGMLSAKFPQLAAMKRLDGDPDYGHGNLYKAMMKPVPEWMELAKSALPTDVEVWMEPDPLDISKTTKDLQQTRAELLKQYAELLLSFDCWPVKLTKKIIDVIAEFAVPVASDVRVSWYDYEEQCKNLIESRSPSDVNTRKPNCAIM
jgi:hypothetical protein